MTVIICNLENNTLLVSNFKAVHFCVDNSVLDKSYCISFKYILIFLTDEIGTLILSEIFIYPFPKGRRAAEL